MRHDPLQETLLQVRRLLLDLERHVDRAAEDGDLTEVARAWARSAQIEHALRIVAPPAARVVAEAEETSGPARDAAEPATTRPPHN